MHKHMANDSGVNSNITAAWFFQDKANGQRTEVTCPLSRRSWGGTRDEPKNVCVGGYKYLSEFRYFSSWFMTWCILNLF